MELDTINERLHCTQFAKAGNGRDKEGGLPCGGFQNGILGALDRPLGEVLRHAIRGEEGTPSLAPGGGI